MRSIKRISAFLLMLMICFNVVSMPVLAATVTQDGLEVSLTTDKEEYSAGEAIVLKITVKNTNQEDVTNVALVDLVSDGYEISKEDIDVMKQIGTIGGGEEISFSMKATAKEDSGVKPDTNQNNNQNTTQTGTNSGTTNTNTNTNNSSIAAVAAPKTDDSNSIEQWVAACVALFVGVAAVFAVRNKKGKEALSLLLCTALVISSFVGASMPVFAAGESKTITVEKTVKYAGQNATIKAIFSYLYNVADENPGEDTNTPVTPEEPADAYTLMWEDQFEGTELNRDDWNVELHEPGWVNNELQEYVDSEDNIYVKDGNLVIQAIKTENGDGSVSYTSGRVNTQNKQDYKYGKFEARIKFPSGQGFLPAFWMMPTDESFYGQWPKCGEIDICEVLGSDTDKTYGTIHFGEPHSEKQGSLTLTDGDFANDFHVFAVEWEPGEIRWYVDGELYHTANDWFTKREGYDEVTYPAPFDQSFYVILNLAVGGNWPGNPDETTTFDDKAQLVVDYVKIYQKDSYDENVTKPEATLKDPDASGNYVVNGDFSVAEDLSAAEDWQFLLAGNGAGTATISDGKIQIGTTNPGELDYSVQLVQGNIALEKGWKYKISFDAYADAERTMIADISAPDVNWIRYFPDTVVNLTTTSQTFSYTFDMVNNSDDNGRVEFNLGNQPSTATVYIDNVRVEKVEEITIEEEDKTVLPDGNYVYNSAFDQGEDRFRYWEVVNNAGAEYSVTNIDNVREFKAVVPSTVTNLNDVVLQQDGLALSGGKEYVLTFDAYADADKTIQTQIAGQTFDSALTTTKTNYKYTLNTAADASDFDLKFLLGTAGTIYIDNVRIQEDGMLINGDFSNNLTGYEVYAYNTNDIDYWVDELNEEGAFTIKISDTGAQDWHIQLKQNNVTLENGKWYKISLDAKSTLDRAIMYALQRDGSADNDWTPYSGTQKINLTSGFTTFEHTFQMVNDTDEATILSISMGAVNGIQITNEHTVTIDNIQLEEVEAPVVEETPADSNIIKNGSFAEGSTNWNINAITAPGAATASIVDGKAVYEITNVGTADWNVQLKQDGLTLEQGATYDVSFKIQSTAERTIRYALLGPDPSYVYYGGNDVVIAANTEQTIEAEITVSEASSSQISFVISMGLIGDSTPISTVTIDDISIVKKSATSTPEETPDSGDTETPSDPVEGNMIQNGNFANAGESWTAGINSPADATVDYSNNKATFSINNVGEANWHLQLMQNGIALESGKTYKVAFKMKSSEARSAKWAFLDPDNGWHWFGGEVLNLDANVEKEVSYDMTANMTSSTAQFQITLAPDSDSTNMPSGAHTVEIYDVSVVEVGGGSSEDSGSAGSGSAGSGSEDSGNEDTGDGSVSSGDAVQTVTNAITNGDFSDGTNNWGMYFNADGVGAASVSDGNAVFAIENPGTQNWHVQLKQEGMALENGATYQMSFDITSTEARSFDYGFFNTDNAWKGGSTEALEAGVKRTITYTLTVSSDDVTVFILSLGKVGDSTPASTVTIDNISLIKQ